MIVGTLRNRIKKSESIAIKKINVIIAWENTANFFSGGITRDVKKSRLSKNLWSPSVSQYV